MALVHAARISGGLVVHHRPPARPGRPDRRRAAGQDPRRHQQPVHHDAHPRPRLRLRQLGLQRLPGLVLRGMHPLVPEAGGPGGRHQPHRRQGRGDPRGQRQAPRPQPHVAGIHRGVPRARLSIDRGLQRPADGGGGLAPHQRQGRQAPLHEGRLPRSRRRPAQPHALDQLPGDAPALRWQPLHRRRVRAGRHDRDGDRPPRGDRVLRCHRVPLPTWRTSASRFGSGCPAWGRTTTTTCSPR